MVFDDAWAYLGLECRVRILEGPEGPKQSPRLFQVMQQGMSPAPAPGTIMWYGQEETHEEFLRTMVEEQRLIYEFDVLRAYGLYGQRPAR